MNVQGILDRLPGYRQTGTGRWQAKCPVHDDKNASLSISIGEDGKTLLYCHAGCSYGSIKQKLGLTDKSVIGKKIVATYQYHDEDGKVLYEVVRYVPKTFRQRVPLGGGKYQWSIKSVRKVPYRLPELLARPEERVFLVEGEKDVAALHNIGLLATTNAGGGASKWLSEYTEILKDRDVCILPDNDPTGREHAEDVANALSKAGCEVKVLTLDGVVEKGDVSDWLIKGGTAEDLQKLADDSPVWVMTRPKRDRSLRIVEGTEVEFEPTHYLWTDRMPLGEITLLAGDGGVGKTYLSMYISSCVTNGTGWPDTDNVTGPGRVIYVGNEDSLSKTMSKRMKAARVDPSKISFIRSSLCVDKDGEERPDVINLEEDIVLLREAIEDRPGTKLLILDPVTDMLGDANHNAIGEVRKVLNLVRPIARDYDLAILAITHLNKNSDQSAVQRILGSGAFGHVARTVLFAGFDPKDEEKDIAKKRRIFSIAKGNLSKSFKSLAYWITDEDTILWDTNEADYSADEIARSTASEPKGKRGRPVSEASGEFEDWLRDTVEKGPVTPVVIKAKAGLLDVEERTMYRIIKRLGLKKEYGAYRKPSVVDEGNPLLADAF